MHNASYPNWKNEVTSIISKEQFWIDVDFYQMKILYIWSIMYQYPFYLKKNNKDSDGNRKKIDFLLHEKPTPTDANDIFLLPR